MTEGTTMLAATRYRGAERLPPIVRAVLDARDEAAVIFGARGDVLYVNQAAQATLPPATITPSIDSGLVRAVLGARGGDVVPLHADAQVLGEMIVVPQANGGTLAERERDASTKRCDRRMADSRKRRVGWASAGRRCGGVSGRSVDDDLRGSRAKRCNGHAAGVQRRRPSCFQGAASGDAPS